MGEEVAAVSGIFLDGLAGPERSSVNVKNVSMPLMYHFVTQGVSDCSDILLGNLPGRASAVPQTPNGWIPASVFSSACKFCFCFIFF